MLFSTVMAQIYNHTVYDSCLFSISSLTRGGWCQGGTGQGVLECTILGLAWQNAGSWSWRGPHWWRQLDQAWAEMSHCALLCTSLRGSWSWSRKVGGICLGRTAAAGMARGLESDQSIWTLLLYMLLRWKGNLKDGACQHLQLQREFQQFPHQFGG